MLIQIFSLMTQTDSKQGFQHQTYLMRELSKPSGSMGTVLKATGLKRFLLI
jgi:hypothetical protein